MKIAWPSSFAEKKSWLRRASAGLFVASVTLAVLLAFRSLDGEARGLPHLVEAALWLHAFAHLGSSLARAARSSASTPPNLDTIFEIVALALALFLFITLRSGVLWSSEPGAFARSRAAALLSTTHLGLPLLALGTGVALAALARVTATTTRRLLVEAGLDRESSSAAVVFAPRVVFAWTIAFGSLALLGYATGSWSLLPE